MESKAYSEWRVKNQRPYTMACIPGVEFKSIFQKWLDKTHTYNASQEQFKSVETGGLWRDAQKVNVDFEFGRVSVGVYLKYHRSKGRASIVYLFWL